MQQRAPWFAAGAAAVALSLAVCGCSSGNPGPNSTSPPVAPNTSPAETGGTSAAVPPAKGSAALVASPLLTAADVSAVSGISGVKAVPRDPMKGAGGDLNFASAEGKLLLMVNMGDSAAFDALKDTPNFNKAVKGLGDEAFDGPAPRISTDLYQLGVKKANHSALLTTYFAMNGTQRAATRLSQAQLKKLAAIILSRWQ